MGIAGKPRQNLCSKRPCFKFGPKISLKSFLPVPSIRPQGCNRGTELAEQGAKVLKLLPNCHDVDCSDSQYGSFWEKLAKLGLPFLAHTGGEFSVPVLNAKFADPRVLRLPLECGVKVIAAHGAGKSGLWDPDYTKDLLKMMGEFPNLFTDNSALASPNRWRTISALLDPRIQSRVIHGSDFPIPVGGFGPWLGKLLSNSDYSESRKIKNPLERDVFIKQAVGFRKAPYPARRFNILIFRNLARCKKSVQKGGRGQLAMTFQLISFRTYLFLLILYL